MSAAPTGTITFLFTDIEGSSRLWERDTDAMAAALARHDEIMRQSFETRGGHIFKTLGDAFCAAFDLAANALDGAVTVQRMLQEQRWDALGPIKVRIALHTGSADERDGDYFGPALNRVSRLLGAAHGGQVLLTLATEELVRDHLPPEVSLRDLGERRLRDLNRPERIFQVVAPDLPADFPLLRSLETYPNNLPVQLTTFIGREKEMEEVKKLLGSAHLLTLTGPGGTGKTRLSLQVAADMLDQFQDGIWLVELATLEDPALVAQNIATALNVQEEPDQPLLATLSNFIRNKRLMLILDNCEHLIAECARIAATLLRSSAELQILASSREPLGVAGERTWPVPSLSMPERWREEIAGERAAERVTQYEAVRLFVDRAMAVRPAFEVTNRNAPFLAEICWRLDGIPLAIELAAARIRVLSVDQIAQRLDDRFRLLTGGSRTAMPRQQTLRALIDWSFDLLTESERILLRRLATFAGGRTLAAVEAVCADDRVQDWEMMDLLTSLVDKSLVTVEKVAGLEPRYTLLESVWDYAREKLAESSESDCLRTRHLDYFLDIANEAAPQLLGPDQFAWVERLKPDSGNFRFALDSSLEVEGQARKGLEMAVAMVRYCEIRSLLAESQEFFGNLLKHPDNAPRDACRVAGLRGHARLAWVADQLEPGVRAAREAVEIARELGDERQWVAGAMILWLFAHDARDKGTSEPLLAEIEQTVTRLNEPRLTAESLRLQAMSASRKGDYTSSLDLFEKSFALYRGLGDGWASAVIQWGIGVMATLLGDVEKARANFIECMNASWVARNFRAMSYSIEAFAALAVVEGEFPRAARLLGAAEALRAQYGNPGETAEQPELLTGIFARASEQFSRPELVAARKAGRGMSAAEAVDAALDNSA